MPYLDAVILIVSARRCGGKKLIGHGGKLPQASSVLQQSVSFVQMLDCRVTFKDRHAEFGQRPIF
jgi:hypothetical protein